MAKPILEILDNHVDQQGLLKELMAEYVAPEFVKLEAKIQSGEIDLIKGTDIDKSVLLGLVAAIKAAVGAV